MRAAVIAVIATAACGRIGFDAIGSDGGAPPGGIDLEVPIEMISAVSPASDVTPVDFDRTRTRLRTGDYDGTVTYAFEIIASNADPVGYDIQLIDRTSGTAVAAITVASGAPKTRFRVPFTPLASDAIYSVSLPGTSNGFRVAVFAARLIVHQIGATRTRIYTPLVCSDQSVTGNTNTPVNGPVDNVMSGTYVQANPDHYALWRKDTTRFASMAAGTPWTFEAMLYDNTVGHGAFASLFDATTNQQVVASEVVSGDNATADLVSATFADSAAGFTEGDDFEVRVRGDSGAYNQYLYKAGLWLELSPLSRGEIAYRIGGQRTGAADLTEARGMLDLDAFSHPVVAFEAVAYAGGMALIDEGTADSGTGNGPGVVSGSSLAFGAAKAQQRSAPLALTSANRYYARTSGGTVSATSGSLILSFGP